MTMLYPNLCYNEVCYKGTALSCRQTMNSYSGGLIIALAGMRAPWAELFISMKVS